MGSLKKFNLNFLIYKYDVKFFFESGTWKGIGLKYACASKFQKLISSEIVSDFATDAAKKFSHDKRVKVVNDSSVNALASELISLNGNCLFWLDAHYPGADDKQADYNDELDEDIRLPLEKEVEIISKRVNNYNDVIIIDDLRIYEDGPYKNGNIPHDILPPTVRNIDFIYKYFTNSHVIEKFYDNEGYVVVYPKDFSSVPKWYTYYHNLKKVFTKKIM